MNKRNPNLSRLRGQNIVRTRFGKTKATQRRPCRLPAVCCERARDRRWLAGIEDLGAQAILGSDGAADRSRLLSHPDKRDINPSDRSGRGHPGQAETEQSLEAVKAAGVTVTYPDKAPFRAAVEPMKAAYAGTDTGELLDAIKSME